MTQDPTIQAGNTNALEELGAVNAKAVLDHTRDALLAALQARQDARRTPLDIRNEQMLGAIAVATMIELAIGAVGFIISLVRSMPH